MVELTEKAAKYAAEKSNEVIANALAKAYEDGYRDGYKDREEENPVDLRDNMTEYVDLGLPSGTLWSKDYEKIDGNIVYLPNDKTNDYNLPTEEQWEELRHSCLWRYVYLYGGRRYFSCTGPNGNEITFIITGYMPGDDKSHEKVYFWLNDNGDTLNKKAGNIFNQGTERIIKMINVFMGCKLPIRLVKAK